MATKKKRSRYDDLAPRGNLPSPKDRSSTPGPKKRYRNKPPKRK